MSSSFEDPNYKEFFVNKANRKNVIKSKDIEMVGTTKIESIDDDYSGVKVLLKKDEGNSIKEIKFICSCGQTKTIAIDYSE
ncbi:MAG: hypothetical protein C0425_11605 [Chlorobiaceae bacterium]|nr:hypothetical protein [Chlorobiaceae bacterium]MBA4310960.1 hypothetical protein [Chlorobiaceae bacterium]